MKAELKACPFCGGPASIGSALDVNFSGGCDNCFAETAWKKSPEEAAKVWNGRVPDAIKVEALELLQIVYNAPGEFWNRLEILMSKVREEKN